jgi:cobalt/nickel transport system ATP-binding protein
MPQTAFDVRGVSYRYNQTLALDSLSMQVARGERVALLGANGSGKSTLLRLLAALSFPEQGSISFFGEDITEPRLQDEAFFFDFRRRVGLVFQNPDIQLFNPSVFDEIAFGPLLSGGEKKRVAIASVLVLDPEVLLLDEPTAALDPGSQSQIIDLLVSWGNGLKTVITATHDLDMLENIADRCYVFESGRVAGEGTPLQVLHDVPLLERTSLVRPHHHVHDVETPHPHPHPHLHSR